MNRGATIESWIQRAFDDELAPDEAALLGAAMREHPEWLDAYCAQALLDTELRRHVAGERRVPGAIPASARLSRHRQKQRRFTISLAAAAVLMLTAALTMRMIWAAAPAPGPGITLAPGSRLTAENGASPADGKIARGERVTLDQGVAEIVFPSEVRAVIDGPAVFRWLADDHFELRSGHAWFHVPPAAAGFRVDSPDLQVVDLGTAFGMDLREDMPAQVHVLEGRVEVRARHARREARVLEAGQAVVLRPGGSLQETAADAAKFRNALPTELPQLTLDFAAMRGDSIPIRGTMLGTRGAWARIANPQHARIVNGVGGPGIELDGAAIETDWQGIPGSAARTVALWCRLPAGHRPGTAPPLALWGSPVGSWDRKFKVALVEGPHGGSVLRVSFGATLIDGTTRLDDGEWRHLAVVYHGNDSDGRPMVRMFVDGIEETLKTVSSGDTGIRTEIESTRSLNLSIGRYELPAGDRDPFLRATISDYHIFAGALDTEEIRNLATPP